jgi:glucitol/sorbitol PTS system EIIA component
MSPGTTHGVEADATVLYDTTVTSVGPMVDEFRRQGVVILFDERAPDELRDFAVIHSPSVQQSGPRPGDVVVLGDVELPVLAVGGVVEANLMALGHLDLKADGRTEAALPGDVCVPEVDLPLPEDGMRLRLLRPAVPRHGAA